MRLIHGDRLESILETLQKIVDAEVAKAETNLEVMLHSIKSIPEHTDYVEHALSLLKKVADAESLAETVKKLKSS